MNPARAAAPGEGRSDVPETGSAGAQEAGRDVCWAGQERVRTLALVVDGTVRTGDDRKPQGRECLGTDAAGEHVGVCRIHG